MVNFYICGTELKASLLLHQETVHSDANKVAWINIRQLIAKRTGKLASLASLPRRHRGWIHGQSNAVQVHNKDSCTLAASSSSAAKIPSRGRPWDPTGRWLTLTLCPTTCDPAHLPLVKPGERWASVSCLEVIRLPATISGAYWIKTGSKRIFHFTLVKVDWSNCSGC